MQCTTLYNRPWIICTSTSDRDYKCSRGTGFSQESYYKSRKMAKKVLAINVDCLVLFLVLYCDTRMNKS